jgi:hypothetical protein
MIIYKGYACSATEDWYRLGGTLDNLVQPPTSKKRI